MINNKEKKMIQRYCIYPKIAVVALIFSFVQCALIVPLEMIDDLVFQNKGFQPTGMFTALGFVIIYVIIFCFCALAPKFGMNGKKWKSLIGRLNVKQSETDYSKEVSAALASQAVGRFLKESDNDTAKNIGSAMQVAGAVSTVSTSIDKFFLKWSNIIRELGAVFRKAEGKVKNSLMENVWTLTFVKLYLAYDMEKDFLPQFEDNSEDLLALMQFMPIPKGGKK